MARQSIVPWGFPCAPVLGPDAPAHNVTAQRHRRGIWCTLHLPTHTQRIRAIMCDAPIFRRAYQGTVPQDSSGPPSCVPQIWNPDRGPHAPAHFVTAQRHKILCPALPGRSVWQALKCAMHCPPNPATSVPQEQSMQQQNTHLYLPCSRRPKSLRNLLADWGSWPDKPKGSMASFQETDTGPAGRTALTTLGLQGKGLVRGGGKGSLEGSGPIPQREL